MLNLVQSDDFTAVRLYFVRSNETVETASYYTNATRASVKTLLLPNNTFEISVIATVNDSDILLTSGQLTLDSNSGDLYLILRENSDSATGYRLDIFNQNKDEN